MPSRVSDNLTHMSLVSKFWEIGKQYSPDETPWAFGHRNFIKNGEARRPSGRLSVGLRSERSRVRFSLRSPFCILEQDTYTAKKVLVIPRKRWLRPDMTEKSLRKPQPKKKQIIKNEMCCSGLASFSTIV